MYVSEFSSTEYRIQPNIDRTVQSLDNCQPSRQCKMPYCRRCAFRVTFAERDTHINTIKPESPSPAPQQYYYTSLHHRRNPKSSTNPPPFHPIPTLRSPIGVNISPSNRRLSFRSMQRYRWSERRCLIGQLALRLGSSLLPEMFSTTSMVICVYTVRWIVYTGFVMEMGRWRDGSWYDLQRDSNRTRL